MYRRTRGGKTVVVASESKVSRFEEWQWMSAMVRLRLRRTRNFDPRRSLLRPSEEVRNGLTADCRLSAFGYVIADINQRASPVQGRA